MEGSSRSTSTRPRVVIIGGGFAGLFAARALRRSAVDVTLVDRTEHHLFQPLLYQCATGILSEGQIAYPLRELLRKVRNTEFLLAKVVDFDVDRQLVVTQRPGGSRVELPYDHLIVAAGVQQSYFGHDEFAAYAPGMKTLTDALAIRQRTFGAFEMAESAPDDTECQHWLTFAIVGAGPTGVELAGQVRELATLTLRRQYRKINPGDVRVLLFDGGDKPLAAMGEKLADKAAKVLTKSGVELHMHSIVTEVNDRGVLVRDKDGGVAHHNAGTVIWTAGVEAPSLAHTLAAATGAEQDRGGRIMVTPELTIPNHPEIHVVGDVMHLDDLPGMAEVAMQSGRYAGVHVRPGADKKASKPFKYHDLGSAAYLRRGNAVISVGPLRYGGFFGWLSWLFIHIGFLTGYRNRITAVLTWLFAFSREVRRERAFTVEQITRLRDVYAPAIETDAGKPKTSRSTGSTPAGYEGAPR
jgi:NADH dehydrogenase